jgi:hypothetical protein
VDGSRAFVKCASSFEWVDVFLSDLALRNQIRTITRHGEAASADMAVVEADRARIREKMAEYKPRNRFNADETALFAFAPPDKGMASKQLSGKKKEKFRISLLFACNQTGTNKLPIFFIGRSKRPRCFRNKEPSAFGFYYANNKKAWMTALLFEM